MFFIGIFGIEEKDKEIRNFSSVTCPDCGRLTNAILFEHYTFFHIFFVPIVKWNRRYFIRLRCCGAVYKAEIEYGRQLIDDPVINFSRLKKVSSGFGGFYHDYFATCPCCGKSFDRSYPFCPYCGTKL
ncbi:MAG: zinc ribbon domain-containing protein [Christensenellales bacterium]